MIIFISVCFELSIQIKKETMHPSDFYGLQWKLSSCSSKKMTGLSSGKIHVHRCCLKPGSYALACSNKNGPYGWGSSSITILGRKYCHDFIGFKAIRKIEVFGKDKKLIMYHQK